MKSETVKVFLASGLLLLGAVHVRADGLVGDGVHDDTAAIQAMLDTGRSCVYLPPPLKEYRISKALELSSGQERRLDRFTIVRLAPSSGCAMVVNRHWQTGDADIAVMGGRWEYDNVKQGANRLFAAEAPKTYSAEDPTIGIESGARIERLVITNCRQTSAVPGDLVFLSQEGEVGSLERGKVSQ